MKRLGAKPSSLLNSIDHGCSDRYKIAYSGIRVNPSIEDLRDGRSLGPRQRETARRDTRQSDGKFGCVLECPAACLHELTVYFHLEV